MRIALITPGFSVHADDWAIPALLNLARELAKTHELHIFSQRYPAKGQYEFEGFIHHALGGGQRFGAASLQIWLQSSRAIIAQHQKTPFDLLHAFWADEAGFSAAIAGAITKRPVVISLGGGELTRLPDIKYGAQRFLARRLTTRLALKKAAIVTAGSPYQLDLCRAHQVPNEKLRLAPLGVDTTLFHPRTPAYPELCRRASPPALSFVEGLPPTPRLIQAASLVPVKNQTLLLEILRRVKDEIPSVQLDLLGSGPLQNDLTQLARRLDLSQNINRRGYVPYPQLHHHYRQAHLYLQTSRHESQGMAVLEAMACGVPVLGTPVGVAKDVACQPATWSPEALAVQTVELLHDEARHAQFSQQARQLVETQFSLPVITNNFLSIYQKLQYH